jgi:aminoglycoside 6'-N-acetyltransferase I
VVAESHRRQGIGRALAEDLEHQVEARGGLTLYLGSDDENDETNGRRASRARVDFRCPAHAD